jgi:hypothetical protein
VPVDVLTEIEIGRPRDEASAYASDPDTATEWYENIVNVERKTDKEILETTKGASRRPSSTR